MKVRGLAVLAMVVLSGCATMGGGGGAARISGNDYVNVEEGIAFQIPRGWSEVESGPFRKPDWIARFEAADGEAAVTARGGDVGARSCIEAARALLGEQGLRVTAEEAFTIRTPAGDELPAWRTDLGGAGRGGRASVFCNGGRVVVLEATASSGELEARRGEIEAAVRSFAYAGAPTLVRVAPPPTPTAANEFVHEITFRGQTLGRIARWYTGSYDNWKKLTELNEDLTTHDVPLRVGRRVRIPRELVVRTDPLPRPRPPKRAEPAPTATPEIDLPAVIGPR